VGQLVDQLTTPERPKVEKPVHSGYRSVSDHASPMSIKAL
jgi:hypothetical protein